MNLPLPWSIFYHIRTALELAKMLLWLFSDDWTAKWYNIDIYTEIQNGDRKCKIYSEKT